METFLADLAALEEVYADAYVERMGREGEAEELETEADLYRYWR